MRVGLIGLGRAGAVHLDACQSAPGVEAVAVCDPSRAAQDSARAHGLLVYDTVDAMLDGARLDAATICSPPANHAPIAVRCLERGLHVLCEKPLALLLRDALKMIRTASRQRRHLMVASKFRHVPEVVRARDLIVAGELGEPVGFEVSFCSPVDMTSRWNAQPYLSGGGVIMDNGCHAFDIVSFLFGSATHVQATVLKPVQPVAVEDSATVQIRAGDGVIGRADLSWSVTSGRDTYLVVYGSRATVEVGWQRSVLRRHGQPPEVIGGPYDKRDAHQRMHGAFAAAVASRGEPWISAVQCLRTVAVVNAAYRSVHSANWECVDAHAKLDTRARPPVRSRPAGSTSALRRNKRLG